MPEPTTYPPQSASEHWFQHYFACAVCAIHEWNPEEDRLCRIGSELRDASINAYRLSEPRADNAEPVRLADSRGSGPIQGAA